VRRAGKLRLELNRAQAPQTHCAAAPRVDARRAAECSGCVSDTEQNGAPFALEQRPDQPVGRPQALDVDCSLESPGSWYWTRYRGASRHRISPVERRPERHRLAIAIEPHRMPAWSARLARGRSRSPTSKQIFPGTQYDLSAPLRPQDGAVPSLTFDDDRRCVNPPAAASARPGGARPVGSDR